MREREGEREEGITEGHREDAEGHREVKVKGGEGAWSLRSRLRLKLRRRAGRGVRPNAQRESDSHWLFQQIRQGRGEVGETEREAQFLQPPGQDALAFERERGDLAQNQA